ncbi:NAD-dependent epimerase/dehydratase family protein [Phytohabitans sp. LJ34]|uniref:NAD-dependent epimerase/dehydratase family protein n=1 Tax=Phytohabitans sp. LJ34 TaxID=3452217 RepID=UPI003F8C3854
MRLAVTGSSGTLGTATVDRLRADGHEVLGLDLTGPPGAGFTRVDLADYGQALDALLGVTARHTGLDALVHLAAVPVNGLVPDATTFHTNMTISFNAFHAALRAGIRSIVYASSITALGFPFDEPPAYLPLDEESEPRANNTYGLVKVLEEAMAAQLVRWRPDLSVTALRFTNVTGPGEYGTFAERAHDPAYRRVLLWTYVDARDAAAAVSLALDAARPGFRAYNVAASDTGLTVPTPDLVAGAFPGVPLRKDLGEHETLMSIDKARAELGYEPVHLWRGRRCQE